MSDNYVGTRVGNVGPWEFPQNDSVLAGEITSLRAKVTSLHGVVRDLVGWMDDPLVQSHLTQAALRWPIPDETSHRLGQPWERARAALEMSGGEK